MKGGEQCAEELCTEVLKGVPWQLAWADVLWHGPFA